MVAEDNCSSSRPQPGSRKRQRPPSSYCSSALGVASILVGSGFIPVAAQLFSCPSSPTTPWAVNAGDAYVWGAQYPQGCTCEQSGGSSVSCSIFDCGCDCDLTAGQCDYNCCCDVECSSDQIARFTLLDTCLPSGLISGEVTTCYNNDQLESINPTGGATTTVVDGLLCVQYDNSPSSGAYYSDPGALSAASISDAEGSSYVSYASQMLAPVAAGPYEGDAIYDKGDRIPAAFSSGDVGLISAYGGYLPVTGPDDSGRCSESDFAQFETPILGRTCLREATSVDECPSAFGAAQLSSLLLVGATGDAVATSTSVASSWISVKVISVIWRDWQTGAETDFTAAYNCDAFYYQGGGGTAAASQSSCALGSGGTVATAPVTTEASCFNSLIEACYNITHNASGSISAVTASLVLSDVPILLGGAPQFSAVQTFSVQYHAPVADSSVVTATAGNVVSRDRSGSPGYQIGFPLLTGTLASNGTIVSAPQGGLRLLSGGACDSTTISTAGAEFGNDALGCCALSLDRAGLQQMCNGGGTALASDGITPAVLADLGAAGTLIGAYGNADPADPSQWLAATVGVAASTKAWDESSGTCRGAVSSLDWKVLWASVGAKTNAQSRVSASTATYGTSNWQWHARSGNSSLETVKQVFLVCSTISYIEYGAAAREYVPPPPPIDLTVPWDVFYPFYVYDNSDAGPSRFTHIGSFMAFLTLALGIFLYVGP